MAQGIDRLTLLRGSLRKRGARRTLQLVASELRQALWELRQGIWTGGVLRPAALNLDPELALHATPYQPCSSWIFRRTLRRLVAATGLDLRACGLVDLGAGKGRALLLALEEGVGSVIGVEASAELFRTCSDNLQHYLARTPERSPACCHLVHGDAAAFAIPAAVSICVLFHPFGRPVLDRVLANLRGSQTRCPRDLYVLYLNPVHRAAWMDAGFATVVDDSPDAVELRSVAARGSG